jgi:hypothetical protein
MKKLYRKKECASTSEPSEGHPKRCDFCLNVGCCSLNIVDSSSARQGKSKKAVSNDCKYFANFKKIIQVFVFQMIK